LEEENAGKSGDLGGLGGFNEGSWIACCGVHVLDRADEAYATSADGLFRNKVQDGVSVRQTSEIYDHRVSRRRIEDSKTRTHITKVQRRRCDAQGKSCLIMMEGMGHLPKG